MWATPDSGEAHSQRPQSAITVVQFPASVETSPTLHDSNKKSEEDVATLSLLLEVSPKRLSVSFLNQFNLVEHATKTLWLHVLYCEDYIAILWRLHFSLCFLLQAKAWVNLFTSLSRKRQGYEEARVTPYMHAMAFHMPVMINMYGNIKQFTGQGTVLAFRQLSGDQISTVDLNHDHEFD